MVVTAITATAVCAIIINGLDNTRVHLYYRYRTMAEEVLNPYGGHVEYGYTEDAECYVIYNSQGMEVGQGSIPYGEGSLTSDEGRLLIVPEYSPGDAALDYAARTVQVLAIPVSYLGAIILCAVIFYRRKLKRPIEILNAASAKIAENDLGFTVETVSCLGACGLAPVLTVNDEVHPAMTPDKAAELVAALRKEL